MENILATANMTPSSTVTSTSGEWNYGGSGSPGTHHAATNTDNGHTAYIAETTDGQSVTLGLQVPPDIPSALAAGGIMLPGAKISLKTIGVTVSRGTGTSNAKFRFKNIPGDTAYESLSYPYGHSGSYGAVNGTEITT